MNGAILLLPLFFIRYIIFALLNPQAIKDATFFAPLRANEKAAFLTYQFSQTLLVILPAFFKITTNHFLFPYGLFFYLLGLLILLISSINFSIPKNVSLKTHGIYKFSRNPMYISYFLIYVGCGILLHSIFYIIITVVFQIATHQIILSEERWCKKKFTKDYLQYLANVKRYL